MDAFLDELGPEQFEEQMAYHKIEPWGDDWRRTGTVAAMIWNAALLALGCLKDPPGPMVASDCIPYRTVDSDKPEAPLPDPVAITQAMQERWG